MLLGATAHPALRWIALLLAAALGIACAGASPAFKPAPIPTPQRPLFDDVSIHGLVMRDERVAERTTSVAQGLGSTTAYGRGRPVTVTGQASAVGSSVTFETFDNYALLQTLQLSLEDARISRRIVGESRYAIGGRVVRVDGATGAGRILWNMVNVGSLLMLVGGPFLGSVEVEVQLRVYDNGELLRTYPGVGRGNWWATYFDWFPQGKSLAGVEAAHLAVLDAVGRLVANPPEIDTGGQ